MIRPLTNRRGATGQFFVWALFIGLSVPAISQEPSVSDQNDFYYYNGARVRLNRSLTECVVRFDESSRADKQGLIADLLPSARVGREIRTQGRAFHVVTMPSTAGDAGALQCTARLGSSSEVAFVSPVFYQFGTNVRMLPTDEIIVKLKPGTTRAQLDKHAAARGLVVFSAMPGTKDEYVLRLSQVGERGTVEESRALFETGWFVWVEPNFIQELRRLPLH